MTQEILNDPMFLSVEQQNTTKINYDEVIETFKWWITAKRRLK